MAKPNYPFEKRQRDLKKRRKQEEKRRRKLAGRIQPDGGAPAAPAEQPGPAQPDAGGSPGSGEPNG